MDEKQQRPRAAFSEVPLSAADELILEFEMDPEESNCGSDDIAPGMLLHHLRDLPGGMEKVIADLQVIHGVTTGNVFTGFANVNVTFVEMRSPLRIGLGITRVPKNVVQAFLSLCESILYYRQKKMILETSAADAWEEARAKRLKNVKTAIEIATSAGVRTVWPEAMDKLLSDTMELERAPFIVKALEADFENERNAASAAPALSCKPRSPDHIKNLLRFRWRIP
jgi:hypothetical protein